MRLAVTSIVLVGRSGVGAVESHRKVQAYLGFPKRLRWFEPASVNEREANAEWHRAVVFRRCVAAIAGSRNERRSP